MYKCSKCRSRGVSVVDMAANGIDKAGVFCAQCGAKCVLPKWLRIPYLFLESIALYSGVIFSVLRMEVEVFLALLAIVVLGRLVAIPIAFNICGGLIRQK